MIRLCTIILNVNRPAMTVDCVRAALTQETPDKHFVLVIDNGSSSRNRTLLREGLSDRCEYLQVERNVGFAGGMNIGIQYAIRQQVDFVWLLNNDAFPEPGCLRALVSVLKG